MFSLSRPNEEILGPEPHGRKDDPRTENDGLSDFYAIVFVERIAKTTFAKGK